VIYAGPDEPDLRVVDVIEPDRHEVGDALTVAGRCDFGGSQRRRPTVAVTDHG
jgi:hypothetical protein